MLATPKSQLASYTMLKLSFLFCCAGDAGKSVNAYFPPALWYNWYDLSLTSRGSETLTIPTPLDIIPVVISQCSYICKYSILEQLQPKLSGFVFQIHIRGGSVVPLQDAGLTTEATRQNPYSLLIALDSDGHAKGNLYVDDGISIDNTKYELPDYHASVASYSYTMPQWLASS